VTLLKEVIQPSKEFSVVVDDLIKEGATIIDSGEYGTALELNSRVFKVTTDSEELEDAQQILQIKTKYFAYIHGVTVYSSNLGTIEMQLLYPYTGTEAQVPIENIKKEAEELGIYPDLEGTGGSIRMQNIMQDSKGRVKVIDV